MNMVNRGKIRYVKRTMGGLAVGMSAMILMAGCGSNSSTVSSTPESESPEVVSTETETSTAAVSTTEAQSTPVEIPTISEVTTTPRLTANDDQFIADLKKQGIEADKTAPQLIYVAQAVCGAKKTGTDDKPTLRAVAGQLTDRDLTKKSHEELVTILHDTSVRYYCPQ